MLNLCVAVNIDRNIKFNIMEPIIKEKETVYTDGYGHRGGGFRDPAARALGIIGTVGAGISLLGRGGVGAFLNGGGGSPVTVNTSGGCVAPTTYDVASKECADILALTKGVYDLKIDTMKSAYSARETDIREKFGLYINNRDNIDRVNSRINDELFSLYKYTRDKDDDIYAKISAVESAAAVNAAVRPYQDKLIQCEIEKNFTALKNYIDRKTCRMIEGVNTLPLTPEVTGVLSQSCCNRLFAAETAAGA